MQTSTSKSPESLQAEFRNLTTRRLEFEDAARAAEQLNCDLHAEIQLLSNPALPHRISPHVPIRDISELLAEIQRILERAQKVYSGQSFASCSDN